MSNVTGKIPAYTPSVNDANRLGLDYAAEARRLGPPPGGRIFDIHAHINGPRAAEIYARVADLYGVRRTWSMTPLDRLELVRGVLGDRIQFIAVPNYMAKDRLHNHGRGFLEQIRTFADHGARIVKFWAAPRGIDYGREAGDEDLLRLDAPARIEAMELAIELGMIIMTHVADPDTWFAGKYSDTSVYGTKAQQYEPLERLLDRFRVPWIAAHLGGWPEDLDFLTGLLERHENLFLDTSAVKWMVRELSKHDRARLVKFFTRFRGRLLFGSDIVTSDEHLAQSDTEHEVMHKANSASEAFDLYASRYWAMRTLFETDHEGPSPISDPDLAMLEPDRYDENDAPSISGKSFPADLLESIYHDAASRLLGLG